MNRTTWKQVRKAYCPWQYWHRSCCCIPREKCDMRMWLNFFAGRVKSHFREVVMRLFCWTNWGNGTVEVGWRNRRLLVETSKSIAAEQHFSYVGRAAGQQASINLILMAFINGNSSLEPLLEGLFAQIHIDLSRRDFRRNRTGDLRMTQNC